MEVSKLKRMLLHKKKRRELSKNDFLSTGSKMLDLACTGKVGRGFLKGKFYYMVGDSQSGKTFLSLTCLAEAANNNNFDNYRFIFDNSEDGALMDVRTFFGSKLAERLEPPAKDNDGEPIYSSTIEDFYFHLDDAANVGKPFIYVLDSMDSLSSEAEIIKFKKQKKAYRRGKDIPGSYGDGKAKKNSSGIRQILPKLRETGSILIVISQTRDNIGFGFETKTRAGGRALKFYATLEIWSSCGKKIKKTIKGKPRIIGVQSILEVKKNRVNGKDRLVKVPIIHSIGIDDIGGCVHWLIEEGHWKGSEGKVSAGDFDYKGKTEGLIKHIEKNNLEKELYGIVQQVWDEIEEACSLTRKKRYQ